MTKGKIEAGFARLARLGSGGDGEDVTDVQESMRRAGLLTLVATPPGSTLHLLFPRTINRIEHEVRGVIDRVTAVGYTESDEDAKIVSELTDDIRDALIDYQVSGNPKPFL